MIFASWLLRVSTTTCNRRSTWLPHAHGPCQSSSSECSYPARQTVYCKYGRTKGFAQTVMLMPPLSERNIRFAEHGRSVRGDLRLLYGQDMQCVENCEQGNLRRTNFEQPVSNYLSSLEMYRADTRLRRQVWQSLKYVLSVVWTDTFVLIPHLPPTACS